MCGRYTIRFPARFDAALFGVREWPALSPRFNIAPGTAVPLIRLDAGRRELTSARWGLIPSWARDATIGSKLTNARAETLAEKPSFRTAWKLRRALLPADGFYEWQNVAGSPTKRPWFIAMADDAPFALGALWEDWRSPDGAALVSCTVITTESNALMRQIHHRMPVIVPRASWGEWLGDSPGASQGAAPPTELLASYPEREMRAVRVSTYVNAVMRDDARCVLPVVD